MEMHCVIVPNPDGGVVASEAQLSSVLSDFARTMVTDFAIQDILDRLVERIVDILPVSGAGVTLISSGIGPRFVAASNEAALRFEQLQIELRDGPCQEAYRTGEAVSVADIRTEQRFAAFVPRALEEGLAAVFTFPLRHGEAQLGALDLYREEAGALDANGMAAAQTLADVVAAYLINAQARSDLLEASVRFSENSLHDPLTGLPNRVLFLERLDHALRRARRTRKIVAVLFADLDRFKSVNDAFGHRVGDEVLTAVASRMVAALRQGDTLGRVAGDEFVILCEELGSPSEADLVAHRLHAALRRPFFVAGHEIEVTASVGIAFAGQGESVAPEQILHQADTAVYKAKRRGGARDEILDVRLEHRGGWQDGLSYDLVEAVARGQMRIVYQPIVTASDGRITGVEALLRWSHPERGIVPPAVFIPLAEQAGLITDIGRWAMEAACRDRIRLRDPGRPDQLGLSLNVSVHQLMSPDFATTVADVLGATSTDPQLITLELTESAFIQNAQRASIVLNNLKDLGVSIALDDFGTGFSSLSLLNRFPVDIVKIDRSFVKDLAADMSSQAIVSAVIDLSHALGKTVTAEGVETAQQRDELVTLGCDSCQGYHFARPMAAAELMA
jgi:diguanylate cyclase (GGDEF)-like protein